MARNAFSVSFDSRRLVQQLARISDRALPDAIAEALNETASSVALRAGRNAAQRMTMRRKASRNVRVWARARGRNIGRMFAVAGAPPYAHWMGEQDIGSRSKARGRFLPIPTVAARTGRSKQGAVARRYAMDRLGNIGGSGSKFFIGRAGKSRDLAIWQRTRNGVRMIRSLSHRETRTPPTHWLTDAVRDRGKFLPQRFERAARRRLRRV